MKKLNFNRFFHLHTVSGIVISVGLYIIFFAGAFTLFLEEIKQWEKNSHHTEKKINYQEFDYNRVLDSIGKNYKLYGRDVTFRIEDGKIDHIDVSESKDTLFVSELNKDFELEIDSKTFHFSEHTEKYSIGDLFYNLHFFRQAGDFGYYLSGFVALFFLFAIVSGVAIHWKKIISNFFVFRPWTKLKTIWTDAHTALGVIGLPFQFVYALTGAIFILGMLIAPAILLFDGDIDKAGKELGFVQKKDSLGIKTNNRFIANELLNKQQSKFETINPASISFTNCNSTSMKMKISGYSKPEYNTFLYNYKTYSFDYATGNQLKNPPENAYVKGIDGVIYGLHYANYGNLGTWKNNFLKFIYFIMALITCFVIITGVLIWLEARKKTNYTAKQRRFNKKVGYWYIGICLSMFPITALSFIVAKLLPQSLNGQRETIFNWLFFGGWLSLSVFYRLKKDNQFTNKSTLWLGGVLALIIPLVSGIVSNNWLWVSFKKYNYGAFVIDMLWLFMALSVFYTLNRMEK